ncbi:hypothetical protein J1N35_011193, partial [Gossypium stocksii]
KMPPCTSRKRLALKRASDETSSAPLDHPTIIEYFEDSDALKKLTPILQPVRFKSPILLI